MWKLLVVKSRISKTLAVLRGAAVEAREDDVPTLAQALAYSLFLAIPASMLVVLGSSRSWLTRKRSRRSSTVRRR